MNTILIVSACLTVILAHPNGPPTDACESMIPSHGPSTVSGAPPFEVIIDTMYYANGSSVQVNVSTTNGITFRGFFVQARVYDDDFNTNPALGMFSDFPDNTDGVECNSNPNSGWGHTLNTDKMNVMATWSYDGPCEDICEIAFRVSVVQGNPATRYYTDIVSDKLTFDMDMCKTGSAGYLISSIFTIVTSIFVAVLAY